MKFALEGESNVLITKISFGNSERKGPGPPSRHFSSFFVGHVRGRDGHFQVATFQDLRNERKEIRGSHPTEPSADECHAAEH
jgi:hypothetical protein